MLIVPLFRLMIRYIRIFLEKITAETVMEWQASENASGIMTLTGGPY